MATQNTPAQNPPVAEEYNKGIHQIALDFRQQRKGQAWFTVTARFKVADNKQITKTSAANIHPWLAEFRAKLDQYSDKFNQDHADSGYVFWYTDAKIELLTGTTARSGKFEHKTEIVRS